MQPVLRPGARQSAEEIAEFCSATYGVTFPMTEKIDVNGEDRHEIYRTLVEEPNEKGQAGDVTWNFEKFLVDARGRGGGQVPSQGPAGRPAAGGRHPGTRGVTFDAEPFDWRVTADSKVLVSRGGRQVVVVAGARGAKLAAQLETADDEQAQQLLARATGNYKRGNEKRDVRP